MGISVTVETCSEADVFCAKAKRQQQMFYLCESEATATNVLSVRKRSDNNKCFVCAKAKRQQQMFYLCESEATATTTKRPPERKSTPLFAEEPYFYFSNLKNLEALCAYILWGEAYSQASMHPLLGVVMGDNKAIPPLREAVSF